MGKNLVLDVGCGRSKQGDVNVDIDPTVKPDVVADMHHLPFQDKSFNKVFITHAFEHSGNPELLLRELTRVSKTQVTIIVPNALALFYFAIYLITAHRWNAVRSWLYGVGQSPSARHRRIYTPFSLYRFIQREGFRLSVKTKSRWYYRRCMRMLMGILSKISVVFGDEVEATIYLEEAGTN
ncbi:methyltransferase domain-containing protein [Candidatus Hecatella orcuttiae]|jgi:ubiquinone/menaquinone biosynthesis C-methylase UbiE|uniref:methyltransferase domain-containing protein n=1 Tax=Candidatus Hecatella orcuttiae TaxID=1935119 RepID=UPI002868156D|nr:methyltransferase domain-containing protein [Candidatus Hecatella orcuttiae]